jgi:hypothetical protein
MMTMAATFITALQLAALSQIESGDRDRMIGRNGEVSRYQIMPKVWRQQCRAFLVLHQSPPELEPLATAVARNLWENRVQEFTAKQGRYPTRAELYLLWHRPARVLAPTDLERERAERFANLLADMERGSHR